MELTLSRPLFKRDGKLYGQFLEHFHRQVYGGVYEPGSPLADADGFRTDVLDALRQIATPVIRWPGGCYVSAYHWRDGVGAERRPAYNKAWRVEDDNRFGTDEFVALCRKLGCEPYICTNAGTGTPEEMSDWLEYCNLPSAGANARLRAQNGHAAPFGVRYWSIGNENYGSWEMGAKTSAEWGPFVRESAKMMRRVDPSIELSAAALDDLDWTYQLLRSAGPYLKWISLHSYFDFNCEAEHPAGYEACMAYTADLAAPVRRVRGLLSAFGLEKSIRVAYDEWNLRSWHHPGIMGLEQGATEAEYLTPRDLNDVNATYTMADAVFSACFLNMLLRNADLVGMANFAPCVNTRGAIFTYPGGVVLRPTFYVFKLFTQHMGDTVLDSWSEGNDTLRVTDKCGQTALVDCVDAVATLDSATGAYAVSAVNKHPTEARTLRIKADGLPSGASAAALWTLNGPSADAYNDVDRSEVALCSGAPPVWRDGALEATLPPHSVNVLRVGR